MIWTSQSASWTKSKNLYHIILNSLSDFLAPASNFKKYNFFKKFSLRAYDIIGYSADELNDVTLYKYVHPEDLVTFAACHKTCKFISYRFYI